MAEQKNDNTMDRRGEDARRSIDTFVRRPELLNSTPGGMPSCLQTVRNLFAASRLS